MGKRVCVFCGSDGKMSREHVWPDWFNDLIIKDTGRSDFVFSGIGNPRSATKGVQLTVKQVCVTCNTGWMNGTEQQAQPLLEPMITTKGQRNISLARQQQTTIATWATLRSMMFCLARPRVASPIPDEEFKRFYAQQHANTNGMTAVWIGAYVGTRYGAKGCVVSLGPDESELNEGRRVTGYWATMMMFRLVIQVMYSFNPADSFAIGPRHDGWLRIWPIENDMESWPHANLCFGDGIVDSLFDPSLHLG